MNNKKRIVNRIALSALMLSALANPIAASAATSFPSPVKAVTAMSASAVKLQDPLAVAERYAPDTVEAWESLLAQYNAMNEKRKPGTQSISLSLIKGAVSLADKDFPIGEALMMKEEVFKLSEGSGTTAVKRAALVPVQTHVDFDGTIGSILLQGETLQVAEGAAVMPARALHVAVEHVDANPLLQGQVRLTKAVEANDPDEIRGALAQLFDSYTAKIEQLQKLQ